MPHSVTTPASHAQEFGYVIRWIDDPPPPPPPPLDQVVANWWPLYFLIGLFCAWCLVMTAVLLSFSCKPALSAGERKPLYFPTKPLASKRRMGRPSWKEADPEALASLSGLDPSLRSAFVRKVYSILATQLLGTVAMVVGLIYASFYKGNHEVITEWGAWITGDGYYLVFIALVVSLLLLCALMCAKDSYPTNFLLLVLFTACMSFEIGIICVLYYSRGFGSDLLLAFVMTAATFLSLTAFTIFSRLDFSFLAPFLFFGIFLLMLWSCIMSIAFCFGGYSASWSLVGAIIGMILFVAFIVYDTYMIVTCVGVDDYILAAIELYLDIINFFLLALSCLTCADRR